MSPLAPHGRREGTILGEAGERGGCRAGRRALAGPPGVDERGGGVRPHPLCPHQDGERLSNIRSDYLRSVVSVDPFKKAAKDSFVSPLVSVFPLLL